MIATKVKRNQSIDIMPQYNGFTRQYSAPGSNSDNQTKALSKLSVCLKTQKTTSNLPKMVKKSRKVIGTFRLDILW